MIERAIKELWMDEPFYRLTMRSTDTGRAGEVRLSADDLHQKRRFQLAVFKQLGFTVLLPQHSRGDDYFGFVDPLDGVAETEEQPEDATPMGMLRANLLEMLRYGLWPRVPEKRGESAALGWNPSGVACIAALGTNRPAHGADAPAAGPEGHLADLRGLGASATRRRLLDKSQHRVWEVALDALAEEDSL